MQNRSVQLKERLLTSRFAERADAILDMANGRMPVLHGMPVSVERANGKTAPNGQEYHVSIKASTDTIARDCGIIPMNAWEKGGLRNFNENPIILAFHSHRDPIGISVHTEVDGTALNEYWKFHEETELSRTMKTLYEKGYMRAASVGFLVHDFVFVDELDDKELEALEKKYGKAAIKDIYWIARKAELLETSAVPVPSDPNALAFSFAARNADSIGLDITSITEKLRSTLMNDADKAAAAAAEAARLAAATPAALDEAAVRALIKTDLDARFASFETRLAALEKPPVAEKSAAELAAEAAAAVPAVENGERMVSIEVRDGETKEDAISRLVDEQIAKLRGAPISRSSK